MRTVKTPAAKIISLILVVVMLMGVFPITGSAAYDGLIEQPLTGATSGDWDFVVGDASDDEVSDRPDDTGYWDSGGGNDKDDYWDANDLDATDDRNAVPQPLPDDEGNDEIDSEADSGTIAAPDEESNVGAATPTQIPLGASGDFFLPDDVAADFIAFLEGVEREIDAGAVGTMRGYSTPRAAAEGSLIAPMAGVGDIGSVTWSWGEPVSFNSSDGYYVANIPRIVLSTPNPPLGRPFCAEFGPDPAVGRPYTASASSNDTILRLLIANYEGRASAAGTQMAIWSEMNHRSFASYGPAATALSAAASVNTTGYTLLLWDAGTGQPFFTLERIAEEAGLKIIKQSTSGKLLSGAEFSVSGPGVNATGLTTNNQGMIMVEIPMPGGTYTVTETSPPDGYLPANPASQTVVINSSNPTGTVTFINESETEEEEESKFRVEVEVEVETKVETMHDTTIEYSDAMGQVTIVKQDQDGRPLAGALFNILIEFSDGSSQLIENWEVYNGARLITWEHPPNNIDPAKVTAWEVQPPRYYEGDPLPKTAEIRPSYVRTIIQAEWTNTHWTYFYRYTVIEIDPNGGETIVDSWTESRDEFEVSTPNFNRPIDPVIGDREIEIAFRNQRITGDIIVEKRDANTNELLSGATIHLWGEDLGEAGQRIDEYKVTGDDGKAYFTDLPPGTYIVQETQPPIGYNGNNERQSVVLQSGDVKTVVVRNYKKDGLFIKKVDEHGKPLPGATFELRRGSGEVLHRDVTDENGLIYRGYLTDDTYVIEEIAAPEGYLLDENPTQMIRIYASDDNKEYTVTFVNKKKPAIEIEKIDALNPSLKLSGAVFRVTDTQTGNYWDVTTGEDGKGLLEGLEINTTYIVEELTPPAGYVNSGYRQEITLREARTHTIVVENSRKPELKIVKKDADTGELLEGATFRISLNGSNDFQDITTDSTGVAVLTGMDPGNYTVVEIKAATGYILDDTPHTVTLGEGKDGVLEISNHRKPTLTIIKKDKQTEEVLAGASFRITWNNGADYRDVTTKEDGLAVVTDLETGWYTITELRAPDGYLLITEPVQVYLKPGENAVIQIYNEAKPSLEILKVDNITQTPLQYARFRIEQKTDTGTKLIGNYTSDEDGIIFLEDILPGRYLITEIEAPDGYNIDTESLEVTIDYGQKYQVTFTNTPKSPIYILKVDEKGTPLMGAQFRVTTMNGALVGTYTSGRTGYAIVPYAEPGWYVVEEIKSPDGFILNSTPVNIELKSGKPAQVEFVNFKKPTLEILKLDADTQTALIGAKFKVTKTDGSLVGSGEYTTDANGLVVIEDLDAGSYIVSEIKAPDGFILDITPQTVELKPGETKRLTFYDTAKPGLQLVKLDKLTNLPVGGAKFNVTSLSGGMEKDLGVFTTSESGTFYIPDLAPGYFVIKEIQAAEGYILDPTPQTIYVEGGKLNVVRFYNTPYSDLRLLKIDSETREPLEGAIFKLFDEKRLEIGTYTTTALGEIYVSGLPSGIYFLQEVSAPEGYLLDSTVRQLELFGGKTTVIEVKNTPLGSFRLIKVDKDTGEPLYGVTFQMFDSSNTLVGEYTTDQNGVIALDRNLKPGKYKIRELSTVEGYVLSDKTFTVEIKDGQTTELVVENVTKPSLKIIKVDSETKEPMAEISFELYDSKDQLLGRYKTDQDGIILLQHQLDAGKYRVREVATASGYVLDTAVRSVVLRNGETTVLEIENIKKPSLRIVKVDSDTKKPLSGVVFELYNSKGDIAGKYTTDENGLVLIENELSAGKYKLKEISTVTGYVLDSTVRNITLKDGETTVVEVENIMKPSLRIVKVDSVTKQRLGGIVFELYSNSNALMGRFTTDSDGEILIDHQLSEGKYKLREVSTIDGYVLDDTVRSITLKNGETTQVEIANEPMGSLRIVKLDEKTKKRLIGATFLIYDSKNNVLGEYTTDRNGEIILEQQFAAGKYQIKEIKSPDGYVLDDKPRPVTIKNSETCEIVVYNELEVGNIQIVKVSDGPNSITKDKAGAALSNAVFEIYDERLNIVDKITTDKRGIATSKDLPLGKYVIKEVSAPKYYFTDGEPFYAELKLHGDLIRFKVENTPEEIEVSVTKRGVAETMAGELVRYQFSDIANGSNCSLDSFYWKDELPTDAVRIQSLNTGTWSEKLTYDVWVKTNLKDWKKVRSSLSSSKEHTIDMTPSALGLAGNEYVTQVKIEFGTVDAGFHSTTDPFIEVRVNNGLPQGYRFTNRTDVGGKRGDEWTYDLDTWITVIYKPNRKLPKTGY